MREKKSEQGKVEIFLVLLQDLSRRRIASGEKSNSQKNIYIKVRWFKQKSTKGP